MDKKIICPYYGYDNVDAEDVIPENDYTFCRIYKKNFHLSDMLAVDNADKQETEKPNERIDNPPRGAWVSEKILFDLNSVEKIYEKTVKTKGGKKAAALKKLKNSSL